MVEQVSNCDLLLVGTPVHGYIVFGQRPAVPVKEFLEQQLPVDISGKPVIGFATYLFFPAGALKSIKKAVEARNGKLVDLIAERGSKKKALMEKIITSVDQI